ncbi:MAG: hypothetical protein NC935_02690 [Candidatus Omnitrophica bacterium]|nr:hypothetical protein [Candidatus Omnitrophota bacterium]
MAVLKFFSSLFKSKDKKLKSNKKRKIKKANKKILRISNPKSKKVLSKKTTKVKEKEIGTITHYFDKISVGAVKLRGNLCLGDKIHIKGKRTDFTQNITSMQLNHKDITEAKKGWEIGIKVIQRVYEKDKVYKFKH